MKLARELGLARKLSPAEYQEIRQNRERVDRAARVLYARIQARRLELLEELRDLGRMELQAHEQGTSHLATWDALALVCRKRPLLLAELAILENCGAADLLRFLSADAAERTEMVGQALIRGGVNSGSGAFVDLCL